MAVMHPSARRKNKKTTSTPSHKTTQLATLQAPFDKRIRTLAMPMMDIKSQIQRGSIVQAQAMPGYVSNRSGKFILQYLYNPSTLDASYSVQSTGGALSYMFPNPGDAGDLAVPLNQSVSWTIMYDRTYELNSGSYDSRGNIVSGTRETPTPHGITADPTVWGVWADVLQLQFLTGMMLSGSSAANANNFNLSGGSGSQKYNFSVNQGFMMMIPCWAFFGGHNNINYYGYISSCDVTVTHWTQWMVPMRCVIDITFNLLPPPQPTGKTGSGSAGFFPGQGIGGGIHIEGGP